ncbi:MAG: hypothetical protein ABL959_09575 [Pyrinomonadaceae bacterium]
MKILVGEKECLSRRATIAAAGVLKDQLVKISGDATVAAAGADDIPVGHISVPVKSASETNGECTVEFHRFRHLFTAKAVGGALAAGAQVKLGAVASGQSTVADLSTGDRKLMVGIVWIGGAENAEVTVLGY